MANPLYQQMQRNSNANPISNFMEQFNQFRQSITGNPQQMVQSMLNSGKMSQNQFNALAQQANQIMQMMGGAK